MKNCKILKPIHQKQTKLKTTKERKNQKRNPEARKERNKKRANVEKPYEVGVVQGIVGLGIGISGVVIDGGNGVKEVIGEREVARDEVESRNQRLSLVMVVDMAMALGLGLGLAFQLSHGSSMAMAGERNGPFFLTAI